MTIAASAPEPQQAAASASAQRERRLAANRQFGDSVGSFLRQAFAAVAEMSLPPSFVALLESLGADEASQAQPEAVRQRDAEFKTGLAALIPQLRAFGRSLSNNADTADDLVQETMLKAWTARDSFTAGSSLRAWTHVILRNVYFSQTRRAKFKGEWNELAADILLAQPATQEHHVALNDLQRALVHLPVDQREAVILMGAGGMTCEEVAEICQCPVGTVKSRVSRGRAALKTLLDGGQLAISRADALETGESTLDHIMLQAHQLADPGRSGRASIAAA